jgi:dihydrofolate reductase
MPGMKTVVCSRALRTRDYPDVTITSDATHAGPTLKAKPGKDIWLFGAGTLFRCLLDAGLVDTIEASVMPILRSDDVPLSPPRQRSPPLRLWKSKPMPSGIVRLT